MAARLIAGGIADIADTADGALRAVIPGIPLSSRSRGMIPARHETCSSA
jgi:hypothetical protein